MKKLFIMLTLILSEKNTLSQVPDSTLSSVFDRFQPEQLRALAQLNYRFNASDLTHDLTKDYLAELSFKIPILNPISNQRVNSTFGYRIHPISGAIKKHQGIDLAGVKSQPIYAAADGIMIETGYDQCLGNFVKIKHLFNFVTTYGHLQDIGSLPHNSEVYQGQIIGYCGSSGRTTGVHLHFAITWKNNFLNPYPFIF
jgi:murein DD-endopeptidase MepM/ murein hydrolase activator NlpD